MTRLPRLITSGFVVLVSANSPKAPRDDEAGYIISAIGGHGHGNTTTGLQYAKSCVSQSKAFDEALNSWETASVKPVTDTVTLSEYTWVNSGPSIIVATSLTTLCDAHPRVVGSAQTKPAGQTTFTIPATTYPFTQTFQTGSFPTPPPRCSINPSDCDALYTSALATTSYPNIYNYCFGSSKTYSTDAASHTCNNCYIKGRSARLLYWPVRTKPGGNLCGSQTPEFIPATPTGTGPNTAVFEGVTITSPTVAISFESLSRIDGCGTTVPHTIVTVKPEDVTSVRGARAVIDLQPFAFQDLNYHCQAANSSTYTIQDVPGDDCYQEVPAEVYLNGNQEWGVIGGWPSAVTAHLTLGDKYAPQILPPSVMADMVTSIWGDGCGIFPDGVWDPPLALQHEAMVDGPTRPVDPLATISSTSTSTPPTPAEPSVTHPSKTNAPSLPTTISITAAPTVKIGTETLTYTDVNSGSSGVLINDHTTIVVTTVITVGSQVISPGSSGSIYVDGTAVNSPEASTSVNVGSDTYSVTSGSNHTYVIAMSGTSLTISSGSTATIGSVVVSAGSDGVIMNSSGSQTTIASHTATVKPSNHTSSDAAVSQARLQYCTISLMISLVILLIK